VAVVPQKAPPCVALNPRRHLVLDVDVASAASVFLVTGTVIHNQIFAQTATILTSNYFTLEYIHVWGPTAVGAQSSVTISDPKFGTRSTGDSTSTDRARAGIMWPKVVQETYGPSAGGTLATVNTSGAADALTLRIGVTYWGA